MTVDEALNIAVIHTLSIKHGIAVSEAAEAASILAAEVRPLRDEVNGLTGSLDRADKALKEAQQQPAVAWMIHEYQGTGEKRLQFQPHIPSIRDDVTGPIVTALYARPVPAAPAVAVPAVPDATCKQCLQVDRELREVIAGLVAIAEKKGKRQGSPNHCHQRPGIWDDDNGDLAGKPCSECAIYDRARALLQSADHSELAIEKVAPDCRACVNRGRINGLSQESYCDSCVYEGRGWRQNHFVDASKMVDTAKRRCEACAILPCSCK